MIDDIITDGLGFGVKLHDGLLEDLHLLIDVGFFNIHALRLFFSGLQRGFEHHVLFLKSLLIRLNFISALFQEILLALTLLELFMETLTQLLLSTSLVTHTSNL